MPDLITDALDFKQPIYRNIIGINLKQNHFDDLSDNPTDWEIANNALESSPRLAINEANYNAINYVFERLHWHMSRFSNGHFPVWYGSQQLETTFYETAYHWQQFLNDSIDLLKNQTGPIYNTRSVFTVQCDAVLIDLRKKTMLFPFLVDKNKYRKTQALGEKFAHQELPGLCTKSARYKKGGIIVIFNPTVLSNAEHTQDFLYEAESNQIDQIKISNFHSQKAVTEIAAAEFIH